MDYIAHEKNSCREGVLTNGNRLENSGERFAPSGLYRLCDHSLIAEAGAVRSRDSGGREALMDVDLNPTRYAGDRECQCFVKPQCLHTANSTRGWQSIDLIITRCVSEELLLKKHGNFYPSLTFRVVKAIKSTDPKQAAARQRQRWGCIGILIR